MTSTLAIAEADRLRSYGFNAIPSHPIKGHPVFPYTQARDSGLSARSFARLAEAGSHNIQIATGVNWGLAVIDLDGEMARGVWQAWTLYRPVPPTWTVATPSGGLHLWFRIPPGMVALDSGPLWQACDPLEARARGLHHQCVDLLADGFLAKCPPSVKVRDGVRVPYTWLPGRGPGEVPMATLPAWCVRPPRPVSAYTPPAPRRQVVPAPPGARSELSSRELLPFIGDKLGLARSWGLRVVHDRENLAGWVPCHAVGREDRNPSGMFSPTSGRYWEPALGRLPVSLYDLAVMLGAFPDFPAAMRSLETTYGPRRAS